jgi:steroid 5-alpha reductase family enzyme
MEIAHLFLANAAILVAAFAMLWLICLGLKDVTPVDSSWALGMVVMAVSTFLQTDGNPDRKLLLLTLCAAWGIRLGWYMLWRWRHHGPDRRYVKLLDKAKQNRGWGFGKASLLLVFATQAPLLFIVCLPVQLGQIDAGPVLGPIGYIGAALAIFGIIFESLADYQLVLFKADAANTGKVMDSGLWRYTRHPNHFGDACAWWGIYLVAAETATGVWSIVGPILLTWTLMKWSGAPTVEGSMRRKKPDYEDYIQRTAAFFPWPPRQA